MSEILLSYPGLGACAGISLLLGILIGRKSKRTINLRPVLVGLAEIKALLASRDEPEEV